MLILLLLCRMFGLALDLRKWAKKSANSSNYKTEGGGKESSALPNIGKKYR
jgi:hypothetical protein